MEFKLPPLPYSKDALAPTMSAETLEYHYEKHHKGYLSKLEKAIADTPAAKDSLIAIIRTSSGGVFNNAAQVFNHTFFWSSMKPKGGGAPAKGSKAAKLIDNLGGWESFRKSWIDAGTGQFGSGYVWLVQDQEKPKIISTANAETPLTTSAIPLLTADVWEHAYYLDHRNARQAYLEAFCDKLLNWDFVESNLEA